jgi:hypothetical protein
MKSSAKRLRSWFCFVIGSAAVCALQAQTSSPEPLTQQCGRWLTSMAFLDPADANAFAQEFAKRPSWAGWEPEGRPAHMPRAKRQKWRARLCAQVRVTPRAI